MSDKIKSQMQNLNAFLKECDEIYDEIAKFFGFTSTNFWILYEIFHAKGEITQNDLSANLCCPAQTINSAVSSLRENGIVRLEQIPGTKNKKKIVLTKEGKIFVKQAISCVDKIESSTFKKFSGEERETCLSLLKRYVENLKSEKTKFLKAYKSTGDAKK